MKKTFWALTALALVMLIAGCASKPDTNADPARTSGLPDIVRNARRNAPPDTLVGIGSARLASQSQSKTIAEARARAEIARVLESLVQEEIRDYLVSSEVDPASAMAYQESITVTLTNSRLTGVVVADEDWVDGTYYVVVHLSASNAVQEISQAQAAARLAVPAMSAFNAEARMQAAIERENARELIVRDF